MQPREKILAGVLGTFAVVWMAGPRFDAAFLEPLRTQQEKIDTAREARVVAEDKEVEIIQAKGRLARWKTMSLPADRDVAMRVYQEWLTDLTEVSGWPQAKITPDRSATKEDTYITIPVKLEATITWEQLGRFITLFQQAHLLQRVSRLDVNSRNSGSGGPVEVVIVAEALSLNGGPQGNAIAPETTLGAALPVGETKLSITGTTDFPTEAPFVVRVGAELARVTGIAGNTWTVERGLWGTSPRSHDVSQQVQLLPAGPDETDVQAVLAQFVSAEFFAKPSPKRTYEPRLTAGPPPQAYFNQDWTFSVKVDGWNPEWDDPVYLLRGDYPPELEMNAETGEIYWTPAPAEGPQSFDVEVAVMSLWADEPKVTKTLTFKSMRANLPPILEIPVEFAAYFGRPAEFVWTASNPADETDRLSYALEGTIPEGASFDSATGVFRWTPPIDGVPGELAFKLTVTDSGEPPATISRDIKISLADDTAMYTRFEGVFGVNEQRVAFFRDLTVNRQKRLNVGDSIKSADVGGTVEEIGPDFVILASADNRWRIKTGQNLRQLEALPKPEPKAEMPETNSAAPIPDSPPIVPAAEVLPPPAAATSATVPE